MRRFLALLFTLALAAAACGSDPDEGAGTSTGASEPGADTSEPEEQLDPEPDEDNPDEDNKVDEEPEPEAEAEPVADPNPLGALRVPEDYPTIQEAVDAAAPGDIVLIGEGVYNESVSVETDNIVIRGVDRQGVVLDGMHSEDLANGIIVFANGVAVENLTVQNYYSNGVFFTGDYDSDFLLEGYRISHVTALNNRKYGLYAFNATYGLIENSYAAGHTDSGYYVGQCQPCRVLLTNNISEYNTLAYSGTNAGGELYVVNNEFRLNRIGVTPNTLSSEELAPQRSGVFAGNWIHSNGNPETSKGGDIWELAYGVGMVLPGANENLILRNLIENNRNGGVAISFLPDGDILWQATDNQIRENVFIGNGIDIVMVQQAPGDGLGNCFAGNNYTSSRPADIETVLPCDGPQGDVSDMIGIEFFAPPAADENVAYEDVASPGAPDQPGMADPLTAPAVTADVIPEFDTFDLDAITVPSGG
jgi:nitrous oxidase accessory protein NosD